MIVSREAIEAAIEGDEYAKYGTMTGQAIDRKARTVAGLLSTTDVGIDNLIVPAAAVKFDYFNQHRAVHWMHDRKMPVGTCVNITTRGEHLYCRTFIVRTKFGDDLITMIEDGAVRALSPTLKAPKVSEATPEERTRWKIRPAENPVVIREAVLIEYSFVSVPGCGGALIERMLSRNKIERSSASMFTGGQVTPVRKYYPVSGLSLPIEIDPMPAAISLD